MEVRCADLGLRCSGSASGNTEEELVRSLQQHAAEKHDVPELNQTLVDYAIHRASGSGKGR